MLKQFSEEELLGHPLSAEKKAEILSLMNLSDEDIDTSDIPEVSIPPGTVPGLFYRGSSVRLNESLRRYFWELSRRKGISVNDLVNETLEKALAVAEVAR
jgi:hypothetical protein